MKQKTLREDAHSREAETCRKRPRETPECGMVHDQIKCGITEEYLAQPP